MEYLLQILGSIASIGSIPLALYLYLRSREAKYSNLRREIARILSFQIGDGRELSTFEVQAVIDSRIREHRLKPNSITLNEVVEDLVSETISGPMLNSAQKTDIIDNLRRLHAKGRLLRAIDRYHLHYHGFLKAIERSVELTPEDATLAKQEILPQEGIEEHKDRQGIAAAFGGIAALLTLVGTVLSVFAVVPSDWRQRYFSGHETLIQILLGVGISIVASIVAYYFRSASSDSANKDKKQ